MDTSDNQRNEGASSGSRSNADVKGKKPVPEAELRASTPGNPDGVCAWDRFLFLREFIYESEEPQKGTRADGIALCKVLKKLGMSPEVEGHELCNMLKMSGYAGQDGVLELERLFVFADDFKLLESLRKYNASFLKGELDRGPLGSFFGALEAGAVSGFSDRKVFVTAFRELQMTLTDEDGDSLVRYADLPRDVSISFEQFLETLFSDHGNIERRTGSPTLFRLLWNRDQPLGRMMAFVSSYTRLARRKNLR